MLFDYLCIFIVNRLLIIFRCYIVYYWKYCPSIVLLHQKVHQAWLKSFSKTTFIVMFFSSIFWNTIHLRWSKNLVNCSFKSIGSKGRGFYDRLGADVGTKNPKKSAMGTFNDRSCWFLVWKPIFTKTTQKNGDCGASSALSAVAVNLAVLRLWRQRSGLTKRCNCHFSV